MFTSTQDNLSRPGARVSLVLGFPWQSNRETRVLGLSFSHVNASLGITRLPGKTSSWFPDLFWLLQSKINMADFRRTALIKISCWRCLQIARYRKEIPCHWIVVRTGTKESIRRKADKTLFLSPILLLTICWCYYAGASCLVTAPRRVDPGGRVIPTSLHLLVNSSYLYH